MAVCILRKIRDIKINNKIIRLGGAVAAAGRHQADGRDKEAGDGGGGDGETAETAETTG